MSAKDGPYEIAEIKCGSPPMLEPQMFLKGVIRPVARSLVRSPLRLAVFLLFWSRTAGRCEV